MEQLEPAKSIIKMIKDCWFNTDYTLSPGQRFVLQDWLLLLLPQHHHLPLDTRECSVYLYQNFNDWQVKVTPITHSHLDNDLCCKIDSCYYFHSTSFHPLLGEDLYNCALGTVTHHHRYGCTSPMTPRMTSHHQLYSYQNFNDWLVKVTLNRRTAYQYCKLHAYILLIHSTF